MSEYLNMETLPSRVISLFDQAMVIWISGGWAMIAIAVVALVMFALGIHLFFRLSDTGYASVREKTWRTWINHPEKRKGPIGELLDFVTNGSSLKDTAMFFDELRTTEIAPFDRDLRVMKICVNVAPLLGLLGTVTGMLATFAALASGAGADQTMGMIAAGISEALITTETGLVVALAGLFFQYQLARKFEGYKTFLTHLETVCTQKIYKQLCAQPVGVQSDSDDDGDGGSQLHVPNVGVPSMPAMAS